MIYADELLIWLRGELGRNDIAAHLEALLVGADSILTTCAD